eukprot:3983737-Amphidinium_carterae.1
MEGNSSQHGAGTCLTSASAQAIALRDFDCPWRRVCYLSQERKHPKESSFFEESISKQSKHLLLPKQYDKRPGKPQSREAMYDPC